LTVAWFGIVVTFVSGRPLLFSRRSRSLRFPRFVARGHLTDFAKRGAKYFSLRL
jgi:hypothetical protein